MEFVLYITVSWLVAAYLITNIRKDEVIRSIIVYFILTMLTQSAYDIISLNLKLINITQDKIKYLAFLLNRDIIAPLLMIIFINLFFRVTTYKRAISVTVLVALLTLLQISNLKMQLYSYVNWNFWLTFIMNVFFILTVLIISRFINALQLRRDYK